MIDSIVVSWNPTTEIYFMTVMEIGAKHPVETHRLDSMSEVLEILNKKVKNESECESRNNN